MPIIEKNGIMRVQIWILVTLLIVFVVAPSRGSDSHNHSHVDQPNGGLSLDHGKKWPTDSSLRKGMTEIRAALAAKADAKDLSKLPAADYVQLSEMVSRSLSFIFKNCKLKPEADAMLHVSAM